MRCQHCGHEVPEGSVFCNRCGYRMSNDMACPHCGRQIPSSSVFCPLCGRAVEDNTQSTSSPSATAPASQPRQQGPTYNQQRAAAQGPQQSNAWRRSASAAPPVQPDDDDDDDDTGGGSNFNRNLIIGIVALALIIGLLSALRHCNSQENDRMEARADSLALQAESSQDPMAVFTAELSRNNFNEDRAYTGCAVRFSSTDPDTPERIVGVTYKDDVDRPFIKVYNLTRDGAQWKTELGQTKYFDGRNIIMDNSSLIVDPMNGARAVSVDGKQCLYFAFLNHLKGAGEGNNGRVTLCLYDPEGKKLTTLTYDGTIRSRNDGRQYVYCRGPLESTNSSERRFLQQEAASIGAIHVATQDEIDAEEEAKAKEEEEKALEGEENADAKWEHDNAENMDKIKEGEEVKMNPTQYDKPIFNMKDIKDKIENDRFLVFLVNGDKKGAVYGFNKSTRKYFVIHSGKYNAATGISFGSDGSLNIKTTDGTLNYDLGRHRSKNAD